MAATKTENTGQKNTHKKSSPKLRNVPGGNNLIRSAVSAGCLRLPCVRLSSVCIFIGEFVFLSYHWVAMAVRPRQRKNPTLVYYHAGRSARRSRCLASESYRSLSVQDRHKNCKWKTVWRTHIQSGEKIRRKQNKRGAMNVFFLQ